MKTKKGIVIDSAGGTGNKPNFRFIIGQGKVCAKIEEEIMKMSKGDKATFDIDKEQWKGFFADASDINDEEISCSIELIDFYVKIKSVFEMDVNEKVDIAKKIKEDANTEFKKGEYKQASEKYKEGLGYVEKISNKDNTKEIEELKISFMLNMCNCFNRMKQFPETIKMAKSVIDVKEDNMKAYYYRGMAYAQLDEFDLAWEDHERLMKLISDKNDPGCVALKSLIESRKVEKENKEKMKGRAMFKKGLFDDK